MYIGQHSGRRVSYVALKNIVRKCIGCGHNQLILLM